MYQLPQRCGLRHRFRTTALVHAVLSCRFGLVIIATMIDLVAGLTS